MYTKVSVFIQEISVKPKVRKISIDELFLLVLLIFLSNLSIGVVDK